MIKVRTTAVSFFVLIIAGVTLGFHLPNSKNIKEEKTHEDIIQAFGPPKSSIDLNFGDNPVIERLGQTENVKISKRKYAAVPSKFILSNREPSIQTYGSRNKMIKTNGEIKMVNIDRVSALDGKIDKVNFGGRIKRGVEAYGLERKNLENNGVIERIHKQEIPDHREEKGSSYLVGEPKSLNRQFRSVNDKFYDDKNDLIDLDGQEAKVFRPLFVYRQQIADRYRVKPRKNSIYGAYQYGKNGRKNYIHG